MPVQRGECNNFSFIQYFKWKQEQTSVEASFLENDQEECPGSKSEMSICMTSPHLPLVPSAAAGVLERLRLEASNHRGAAISHTS